MSTHERIVIRWGWLAVVAATVVVACGSDGSEGSVAETARDDATEVVGSTESTQGSTTATNTPTTDAATGSSPSPSPSTTGPVDVVAIDSVSELLQHREDLVDLTVALRARAFFLSECPPPDQVDAGPCALLLFMADADRTGLTYGERDLAVPAFFEGARVTCDVGPDTTEACPGWEQGGAYDVIAVVRRQPTGSGIDLHINQRVGVDVDS